MSDIAIRAENLGKRYRIGGPQARYKTLRDSIADLAVAPVRRLRRLGQPVPSEETIWALKDVSFEVKHGEVVGIIGRNGAGKTTLLKVLSRITEPTGGYAEIHGRVGSLLEVGTGFHPELTGRENIYLNGAILGMSRAEIDSRFDEIVQFAEIEKFLDTPAKRYSSGMYVRLAFAVAAHLEPEILLVDEVLAVGDAAFQKKCLGKMGDVASEGRTVLFVSHNMAAIENLCPRCMVLEGGSIRTDTSTIRAIEIYLKSLRYGQVGKDLRNARDRTGSGRVVITSFHVEDDDAVIVEQVRSGQSVTLVFGYQVMDNETLNDVVPSFALKNNWGVSLILHRSNYTGQYFHSVRGAGTFRCRIPRLPLVANRYLVGANIMVRGEVADNLPAAGEFSVTDGDFFGTGVAGLTSHSPVLIDGLWSRGELHERNQKPAKDST